MGHKAPESPDEEQRRLISEAHAATKDLRAAIRDAREATGEMHRLAQDLQEAFLEALAGAVSDTSKAIAEDFATKRMILTALVDEVGNRFARVLGTEDKQALTKEIVRQLRGEMEAFVATSLRKALKDVMQSPEARDFAKMHGQHRGGRNGGRN